MVGMGDPTLVEAGRSRCVDTLGNVECLRGFVRGTPHVTAVVSGPRTHLTQSRRQYSTIYIIHFIYIAGI